MPKLSEIFFGTKGRNTKLPTLNTEQQQLMSLLSGALQGKENALSDAFGGFNEQEFEKGVSQPAMQNFLNNILPMIQERFISGNQSFGSGMQRALAKEAGDLQAQLAQLLYGARQQQKQNQQAGVNQFLGTKTFQNNYQPPQPGAIEEFIGSLGTGAGKAIGQSIAGNGTSAIPVAVG